MPVIRPRKYEWWPPYILVARADRKMALRYFLMQKTEDGLDEILPSC